MKTGIQVFYPCATLESLVLSTFFARTPDGGASIKDVIAMTISSKTPEQKTKTRSSGPRWIVGGLLVLCIVGALLWGYRQQKERGEVEPVRVTQADMRDIRAVVRSQGKIRARDQVEVGSEVAGRVIGVFVVEGQHVKRGDPLFSLDDEQARNAIARFRVAHRAAQTTLKRAELMRDEAVRLHARNTKLFQRKAITRDAFETSAAQSRMVHIDVEQAGGQVERALLELARAREGLKKTRVVSPQAGQVISVGIEIGQVIGGPSIGGGASLDALGLTGAASTPATGDTVVIADLSELMVELEVDELDVAHVKKDARVVIKTQGGDGNGWEGVVERVGLMGLEKGGATVFSVTSSFPNVQNRSSFLDTNPSDITDAGVRGEGPPDVSLPLVLPGMTVSAEIEIERVPRALAIPVGAIVPARLADLGDGDAAWVVNRKNTPLTAELKTITLGASDAEVVEIESGLDVGDWIVEGPYRSLRTLTNNATVEIEEEVELLGTKAEEQERDASKPGVVQ